MASKKTKKRGTGTPQQQRPQVQQQQRPAHIDGEDWEDLQQELKKFAPSSTGENGDELLTTEKLMSADPSQLGNSQEMERLWAEQAAKHAETYFKVLKSIKDKRKIKLTKMDEKIYEDFRRTFPDLKIDLIDENLLKSPASKDQWRQFCMRYEKHIQDFNFATLLRLDASVDYDANNATVVPRIQFHAIEIARNREGCNDRIGASS